MKSYSPEAFEALRREIQTKIEIKLHSLGIFFRIFSRIKSPQSLQAKLSKKSSEYLASGKKMQDFLGIRITVYFEEDVKIISQILKNNFNYDSESVDAPDTASFSPKRHNLVFHFPKNSFLNNPNPDLVDNTFEVQIRTIFSEGWHEIEHDLRYKNQTQWEKYPTQSRGLNSIIATLEMCDWGISNLINDMAYNAYKNLDLQSLLLNKLKLRLQSFEIHPPFSELSNNKDFLKNILRCNRDKLLKFLSSTSTSIPLTASNILWILTATQNITAHNRDEIPAPILQLLEVQ